MPWKMAKITVSSDGTKEGFRRAAVFLTDSMGRSDALLAGAVMPRNMAMGITSALLTMHSYGNEDILLAAMDSTRANNTEVVTRYGGSHFLF